MNAVDARPRRGVIIGLTLAVAAAGIALRVVRWAGFHDMGFDEALYENYLRLLIDHGLTGYPDVVETYLVVQQRLIGSILPPTRFLYIFLAYGWHGAFGGERIEAFRAVSRVFAVLLLLVSGGFARRLVGPRAGLAVFALIAFSPMEIHMAQHALVDGVFGFLAVTTLWAFWECLQHPGHRGWLGTYVAGLALMVTCKENAFFVFVAILALLAANRWLAFGTITLPLLVATVVGPLMGVAVLANLAGGLGTLCHVYLLSAPKNLTLPYAILTGDGPWYRYLVDLLTVSPLVLILACAALFNVRRTDRELVFLAMFVGVSYLIMCNLKYAMNLRYALIWDLPLRVLAVTQAGMLAARFGRFQTRGFALLIVGLCAFDLNQYYRLAVAFPLYELVPFMLLRALQIIK